MDLRHLLNCLLAIIGAAIVVCGSFIMQESIYVSLFVLIIAIIVTAILIHSIFVPISRISQNNINTNQR